MKKWSRREFIPIIGIGLAGGALVAPKSSGDEAENQKHTDNNRNDRPKKLTKGDVIGICAPAGSLRRREEVDEFTALLNDLGFKVKVGANVHKKQGYFAGSDEDRARDFMDFIQDSEVNAIFFLRGGWGCARILPLLNYEQIKANPKVIMGFSDATSLLNAITKHSEIVTYHGPSGNSSWNTYSIDYLRNTLMETETLLMKNETGDHKIITYVSGRNSGILWGGNLSVITSMIGTAYFPKVKNGILFLEEVGEEPYRIDRMLTQLKQSGALENCNGVILGSFRKCLAEEPDRSFTVEEVFEQHFGDFEKPVFYGAQIGHTVNKFTVPIGVKAEIDADKGTIQLLEPAVR